MPGNPHDLSDVIRALSDPRAFPFAVDHVQVRQTHISAVFLAGPLAYKLKKPIKLPFLDFSTLEQRRFFCHEEVRVNRRLAPDVYLQVVPVAQQGDRLGFEQPGAIVDWAVKMARLPDEATVSARLQRHELSSRDVIRLAERIATFHAKAVRDQTGTRAARFERIAREVRDNLTAAEQHVGRTITDPVLRRLRTATEHALEDLRPIIERRAFAGFTRELHGDLHLDHIYLFPDRPPPNDVVIIDAIEFNESFRWIDVVSDMAFCVMDFAFHGRRDWAGLFANEYFFRTNDFEGRRLLPLYVSYRAAVRAKVEGITACEPEVALAQQIAAARHARAHWLIALGELEPPTKRPALLLVSGLPGTGKSTVARGLSAAAGFQILRTDVIRKELAAAQDFAATAAGIDEGLYAPEWTERTYAECLRRAGEALRDGGRVIVDATFLQDSRRQQFAELADGLGVPMVWLICQTSSDVARQRLETRQGDASDANWTVYQHAAARWEVPSAALQRRARSVDSTDTPDAVTARALATLREEGLA